MDYDAFISHASEDKEEFVRPLAEYLNSNGLRVWYDEFTLKPGDSIRKSIDYGIKSSRYAIVVLSNNFFDKAWPEWELDGIIQLSRSREIEGLLPIWLNIGPSEIRKRSPSLSDIVAIVGSNATVVGDKIRAVVSVNRNINCMPDYDQFRRIFKKHNYIPIWRKIRSHTLTPAQAHIALSDSNGSAYLSSVSDANSKGRYTFVCVNPVAHIKGSSTETEVINLESGTREMFQTNAIDALETALEAYHPPKIPGLPQFIGGAIGFINFTYASKTSTSVYDIPAVSFLIFRTVIVFDNLLDNFYVIIHIKCNTEDANEAYEKGKLSIERIINKLSSKVRFESEEAPNEKEKDCLMELDVDNYLKFLEYIKNGELDKYVMTEEEVKHTNADGFKSFLNLITHNPRPYNYYVNIPGLQLVGSSSEMALRIEDGTVSSGPVLEYFSEAISDGRAEPLANALVVNDDVKENIQFLIDMARNDLEKICKIGSVQVTDKLIAERDFYSVRVACRVSGELRDSVHLTEIIDKCFPSANTIGGPKINAIEQCVRNGNDRRFPFGGWLCLINFNGFLDATSMNGAMAITDKMAFRQIGRLVDGKKRDRHDLTHSNLRDFDVFRYLCEI